MILCMYLRFVCVHIHERKHERRHESLITRLPWGQFGRNLVYPTQFDAENPIMTLPGSISKQNMSKMIKNCQNHENSCQKHENHEKH